MTARSYTVGVLSDTGAALCRAPAKDRAAAGDLARSLAAGLKVGQGLVIYGARDSELSRYRLSDAGWERVSGAEIKGLVVAAEPKRGQLDLLSTEPPARPELAAIHL